MKINWENIEREFHKELCGLNYTRLELSTDDPNQVFNWFKDKINTELQVRKISDLERSKGRSESYHSLTARDQWDEDKRLGILDWDGK
jgi:hypothetical protein